jgi:hypothetical protein
MGYNTLTHISPPSLQGASGLLLQLRSTRHTQSLAVLLPPSHLSIPPCTTLQVVSGLLLQLR